MSQQAVVLTLQVNFKKSKFLTVTWLITFHDVQFVNLFNTEQKLLKIH